MTNAIATPKSVSAAVAALNAAGEKVTTAAVRAYLGGGSQPTIVACLRSLREVELKTSRQPPYPDTFSVAFDEFKAACWMSAQKDAVRELEEQRLLFARYSRVDQEELLEAAHRIQDLETELDAVKLKLTAAEEEQQRLLDQLKRSNERQREMQIAADHMHSQNRMLLERLEAGASVTLLIQEIRRMRIPQDWERKPVGVKTTFGNIEPDESEVGRQADIEEEEYRSAAE